MNTGGIIGTYTFYSKQGTRIGLLSLVGNDTAGKNGGFLAMMDVNLLGILPKNSLL
jgi:hypothetical protein